MFGDRIKHPHNYPDWFPQYTAGPIEAWVYPVQALGDFRLWLYRTYLSNNFPKYLERQVKKGALAAGNATMLIGAVKRPELSAPH